MGSPLPTDLTTASFTRLELPDPTAALPAAVAANWRSKSEMGRDAEAKFGTPSDPAALGMWGHTDVGHSSLATSLFQSALPLTGERSATRSVISQVHTTLTRGMDKHNGWTILVIL
eukprot:4322223-Amphidinium_carterae.1